MRSPTFVTYVVVIFLHIVNMKTHSLAHTGDHTCVQFVVKVLSQRPTKHGIIHSADKPYMCLLCGKGFCQKLQLEPHMMKKHSVQKAYICQVCGNGYHENQALRKHSVAHSQLQ